MFVEKSEPVPSPALVAAWEGLGMQRAEQVPMWAAHWLVQGLNGDGIVALACLDKADVRAVHDAIPAALRDAIPAALRDAGVEPMTELAAAARLAFDHVARMYLDGRGSFQWVISAVTGTFEQNNWAAEFDEEPLGSLFGLDDELAGEWGRGAADIEADVREACERQVQLTT